MTRSKKQDEQYCRSCGNLIKKKAEICPDCGVRPGNPNKEGNDKQRENHIKSLTKSNILTGLGVIFSLSAFGALINGGIGSFFVFGLIGILLLPQTRERIETDNLEFKVGKKQSVKEKTVRNDENPCSICYSRIDKGVVRLPTKELTFFGIPISEDQETENYYCRDCLVDTEKNIEKPPRGDNHS